ELVGGETPLELSEAFAVTATVEPAPDQALDCRLEPVARDAAKDRPGDRRVRAERAAHEDVVGGQPTPVSVLSSRALEAEVAHPVLGARVRAAVEVEAQDGDL